MSLLGKLFSGSSHGPSPRATNPLDSHLEDHFTYNLLFPDTEALCHNDQIFHLSSGTVLPPATTNAFDANSEIDLEMRDVRVIIMQEATPISGSAYLLYDSHAPPSAQNTLDRQASNAGSTLQSRTEGRRSISSPRKSSIGQITRPLSIQQEMPAQRSFGAFDRRAVHNKTLSYNETEGQRSAREYREEVNMISNCIFGSSDVWANKRTETKVHILPTESRPLTTSSYIGEGSLGRSSMRSSKLAQSFTSENIGLGPTSAGLSSMNASRGERKKVLITRMFPVPLPIEEPDDSTPTPHNTKEHTSYPFPKMEGSNLEKKLSQPKQKRTPMYAVGLVIHLPAPHAPSAPISRSSLPASSSYTDQESCPSSYNSARRAGWTMLGTGFGVDSLDSSFYSEPDDRIDMVTQHWDIIMRTVSYLQGVATSTLLPMLRQADVASPDPRRESSHVRIPSGSISLSGKRVAEDIKPFKPPKTNAKLIQLTQHCLMPVQKIHKEVEASRQRIINGIKATQVITGQGRWAIWREEARIVNSWAGGKDRGFFFYNLLNGFLGNHTDWLQALGPSSHRQRHSPHERANKDDEISLPARTIIVSNEKIAARRLIFLLAAFLPTNQSLASPRFHRPSTSASLGQSQSPPTAGVPILKEEPLRRRMNKRSSTARVTQRLSNSLHQGHSETHERRSSDVTSIKTANLPIPGSDIGSQKNNTATTSTVTPVTTMPHFSNRRPHRGTGPAPRPDSSGSLAADDLLRSLKRGDSSAQSSSDSIAQNSRWGSMISGFWGSKRRDSSATDVSPSSVEALEINDPYYKRPDKGKLAQMVDEVERDRLQHEREMGKSETGSTKTARAENQTDEIPEQTIQISARKPDPSGAYESPVRTSINESDGIIDIDVPLPDYLSYDAAVSSPSSSGYVSIPGFANAIDNFEYHARSSHDTDTTLNVGGWLPRYHPDFALQAVPSQADLIDEVKASMRAEPTPAVHSAPKAGESRQWTDISSAIIADTTTFTIKRIAYQRLVRPTDDTTPKNNSKAPMDSRYGNSVYTSTPSVAEVFQSRLDERFLEEAIISMDETLIEAVEKILAHSSKNSSASSSRSRSREVAGSGKGKADEEVKKGRGRSDSDAKDKTKDINKNNNESRSGGRESTTGNITEVHRNECKKMILGALEEVVRSVVEELKQVNDCSGDDAAAKRRERIREREKESFLREGVRGWLSSGSSGD